MRRKRKPFFVFSVEMAQVKPQILHKSTASLETLINEKMRRNKKQKSFCFRVRSTPFHADFQPLRPMVDFEFSILFFSLLFFTTLFSIVIWSLCAKRSRDRFRLRFRLNSHSCCCCCFLIFDRICHWLRSLLGAIQICIYVERVERFDVSLFSWPIFRWWCCCLLV